MNYSKGRLDGLFFYFVKKLTLPLKVAIAGLFNSFDGYPETEITCIINRVHQCAFLVS